jgi:hypothetical protein
MTKLYDVELVDEVLEPPYTHYIRYHRAADADAKVAEVRAEMAAGESPWAKVRRLPGFTA